jgi:hypothetical protein
MLSKPERAERVQGESKHPENVSFAMLRQGVLFQNACVTIFGRA